MSGESGAGKTVSAKYAMRYFATVGGSSQVSEWACARMVDRKRSYIPWINEKDLYFIGELDSHEISDK